MHAICRKSPFAKNTSTRNNRSETIGNIEFLNMSDTNAFLRFIVASLPLFLFCLFAETDYRINNNNCNGQRHKIVQEQLVYSSAYVCTA